MLLFRGVIQWSVLHSLVFGPFLVLPGKSLVLLIESGSNEPMNVLDFRQDPDQIVICHFCWPVVGEGIRGCLQAKQTADIGRGLWKGQK